jgi:hypothetical protein
MNPFKISPTEMKVLLGGILNSVIYYGEKAAQATVIGWPAELSQRLDPNLPTNGEILATVGPPIALYGTKKLVKSGSTKEKVGDLAFGSALYAFPTLMVEVGSRVAYNQGVVARPAARLTQAIPTTRYTQTTMPTPARATTQSVGNSKYRLTA